MTKTCTRCGIEQPVERFSFKNRAGERRTGCKTCASHDRRAWRANNKGKARRVALTAARRRAYGLDDEAFAWMLEEQGLRCASCSQPFDMCDGRSTNIDHCHTTSEIRGILCGPCNRALGHARECPERLRALARYIER